VAQGGLAPPGASFDYEDVWVQPRSPCHGELLTPTRQGLPAGVGDVLLWDVAPLGFLTVEGRRIPRFSLLAVLEKARAGA
jgi:hypothetical protein